MTAIPILCNEKAGAGTRAEDELREAFAGSALRYVLRPVPADELAEAARGLSASGTPVVGVSGGDGTVSTVAGELAGTGTALAVFPGGTLNHFAVALGVDTFPAAVEAIEARREERIDVGEVNGRVFVNGMSIGMYPRQLRIREKWQGRVGKWIAAAIAGAAVLGDFPRDRVVVRAPGMKETAFTPLLWVGPGEGSFRNPTEEPRDLRSGKLELVVIAAASRARLLRIGLRAVMHNGDGLSVCRAEKDCAVHLLEEFTLTSPPRLALDAGIDGELVPLDTPLEFRIRKAALKVFRGLGGAATEGA
ncbi:MAG TPA: diacylglycerol kinase family protein [Longimicrobiaceae bacterium]|jgi:diacylglycerol kinase family enzyme|nr:diacylglycerol kinase family protein [Longimicrobiaceae bacterium]